jgi:hypothetical protein
MVEESVWISIENIRNEKNVKLDFTKNNLQKQYDVYDEIKVLVSHVIYVHTPSYSSETRVTLARSEFLGLLIPIIKGDSGIDACSKINENGAIEFLESVQCFLYNNLSKAEYEISADNYTLKIMPVEKKKEPFLRVRVVNALSTGQYFILNEKFFNKRDCRIILHRLGKILSKCSFPW